MYFSHIGYYNSVNYSGWVDMEILNMSEYIAFTNRYNGQSSKTNFGMINLADRKDPGTIEYDDNGQGPNGHKYKLKKGIGDNCPNTGGLPEPDYVNSVDLQFNYFEAPASIPFNGERRPINLAFVEMTYFDFDSGEDGAKGLGQECVKIDGDLSEYGIHPTTELVKDTGVWVPNVGANG
eukprot:scaffold44213_cov50-Phaeocystis_antarctica.AAC.1